MPHQPIFVPLGTLRPRPILFVTLLGLAQYPRRKSISGRGDKFKGRKFTLVLIQKWLNWFDQLIILNWDQVMGMKIKDTDQIVVFSIYQYDNHS